jgi:hypothetical protein
MTRRIHSLECETLRVAGSPVNGGGGAAVYDVFSGYSSGATNVAGTAVTVPIVSTHKTSANYSVSSGEVTVMAAADYTITVSVSAEASGSTSRTQVEAWLEVESAEVGGTRGQIYCRQTNYGATCGFTVTLALSASDTVRVRAQRTAGGATCPARATIHIDKRT